jgi:hypothetical protein
MKKFNDNYKYRLDDVIGSEFTTDCNLYVELS